MKNSISYFVKSLNVIKTVAYTVMKSRLPTLLNSTHISSLTEKYTHYWNNKKDKQERYNVLVQY